jgi:hypothetical protein
MKIKPTGNDAELHDCKTHDDISDELTQMGGRDKIWFHGNMLTIFTIHHILHIIAYQVLYVIIR